MCGGIQLVAGFPAWVNLSESFCLPEFYRFCLKWLKSSSLNDRQEQEWLNLNSGNGFPHI
jgi:hypothetical protein